MAKRTTPKPPTGPRSVFLASCVDGQGRQHHRADPVPADLDPSEQEDLTAAGVIGTDTDLSADDTPNQPGEVVGVATTDSARIGQA